jgi:hypothetical protein
MPNLIRDIERRIVRKVVESAIAQGYALTVNDGEGIPIKRSTNKQAILASMFSVDEEHLIVRHAETGERIGYIYLVYGNDGHDVICDYTTSPRMEEILKDANTLADRLAS